MSDTPPMTPLVIQYSATLTKSDITYSGDLSISTPHPDKSVVDMVRYTDPVEAGETIHALLSEDTSEWVRDTIRARDEENHLEDYNLDSSSIDLHVRTVPEPALYIAACRTAAESNRYTVPQQLLAWLLEDESEFEMFREFQWTCKVVLDAVFIDDEAGVTGSTDTIPRVLVE